MASRLNKSLEKIAREISSSDEFVEHIANILRRYRREMALQDSTRQREIRQALRTLLKNAAALTTFFDAAARGGKAPESDALDQLGAAMYGAAHRVQTASEPVQVWLHKAVTAAEEVLERSRSRSNDAAAAHAVIAEALRATFEYHRLKFTPGAARGQPTEAVRLLLALGKAVQDEGMTPEAARAAVAAIRR